MGRPSKKVADYLPPIVQNILQALEDLPNSSTVGLVGFGEALKWTSRILNERDQPFLLLDDRPNFVGYDCGSQTVHNLGNQFSPPPDLLILCHDSTSEAKNAAIAIAKSPLKFLPTLCPQPGPNAPFQDDPKLSALLSRARCRAISVNSEDRLYNLVQLVQQTANVPGTVLEIGTFAGGSGAVILETLLAQKDPRCLKLFDSYSGLPASPLGLDARWTSQFANVSLAEVRHAFADCPQAEIVSGDVTETVPSQNGPFSFVHFDTDTFHSADKLVPFIWQNLSAGGALLFDDYGFYPNCLPLTAWVDQWSATQSDAFVFRLTSNGCMLLKR